MKPFFSIIIPLYNKEKHIKATINSVQNQSFTDFEIIVINDGSTDNSLNVINAIKDDRINVFSTENKGVSHARNYGISKVTSDYIAFLDADDFWETNHLSTLKEMLTKFPDCGLYATAYIKKNKKNTMVCKFKDIPTSKNWMGIVTDYFNSSINDSIAWTSAVMIPKLVLDKTGLFNESFGSGEDTDLWIRIALKYQVVFSNTVTAIHNLHTENRISNSNINKRQLIDFDVYESATTSNPSLKKYLDINRFSTGMQYKIAGNDLKASNYFSKISPENLNKKQRLLITLNKPLLMALVKFQKSLRVFRINLTPFH